MSLTREDPELERAIEDRAQLEDFFRAGEKPPEQWRVGTEHEKLGVYEETLQPIPYEGPNGIRALLERLLEEHGFEPIVDGEHLIGLEQDGATITLEPGGQLELSGAPLHTMHETCREFRDHVALMKHVSQELGIIWLGLGIQPLARVDELPRMPRHRHDIMREVLSSQGELALVMMQGTGCVQANFDFESERDMARKLRIAMATSPVVTALYANSSISEGRPNGYESMRAWIWRYTDPDRCGMLPFVFSDEFLEGDAYAAYARWALDVPMMFVQRDGQHVPTRSSFRSYMESPPHGGAATLADWSLHLTTLFPEARLKRFIEVRGADGAPADLVCALSAFWKGLLYDETSLLATLERVRSWSFAATDRMHVEVARSGLSAAAPDGPVLEVARELVELSAAGLRRLAHLTQAGEDESRLLEPLFEIVDRGTSPAREILRRWDGPWDGRIERLVEYARY